MRNNYKRIGLIAGSSNFPILFAKKAKESGCRVIVAAIKGEAFPELEQYCDKLKWFELGDLKKALFYFGFNRTRHLVMAGKVHKHKIFSDFKKDSAVKDIFNKSQNKKDTSLFLGIINKVEKIGFKFIESTTFLHDYLALSGILTDNILNENEQKDVDFGFKIAKEISGLDIGQTVIIKDMVVVAVEGVEGTDQTIKRGAELAGIGTIVVKTARPNQDMRFDVPVVGEDTIDNLIKNKVSVLAVESGKTLFLDKDIVIRKANNAGIKIVGVPN